MTRALALTAILILTLAGVAQGAARHHPRGRHLVLEMKAGDRSSRHGTTLARAGPTRHKHAIATLGVNHGQAIAHPEELNGPGTARFNHGDSTVGAKVSVPF
jgi:hypothetical protein